MGSKKWTSLSSAFIVSAFGRSLHWMKSVSCLICVTRLGFLASPYHQVGLWANSRRHLGFLALTALSSIKLASWACSVRAWGQLSCFVAIQSRMVSSLAGCTLDWYESRTDIRWYDLTSTWSDCGQHATWWDSVACWICGLPALQCDNWICQVRSLGWISSRLIGLHVGRTLCLCEGSSVLLHLWPHFRLSWSLVVY